MRSRLYNKFTDKGENLHEKVFAVWILPMVLPVQASEPMRCGSNLIVLGNTKFDVLRDELDYIELISSAIERRTEEW
ncbi:hypothetical protein [Nitrosomonas sp. Nm51]|uniref:hypothetical protein n=1 Tax=Nitrosomonas sp. Nm51 TaxID=133720 RepID=UPI0015A5501F|nr:hypothetical protein [Nitrosomonas sp. Nm51]